MLRLRHVPMLSTCRTLRTVRRDFLPFMPLVSPERTSEDCTTRPSHGIPKEENSLIRAKTLRWTGITFWSLLSSAIARVQRSPWTVRRRYSFRCAPRKRVCPNASHCQPSGYQGNQLPQPAHSLELKREGWDRNQGLPEGSCTTGRGIMSGAGGKSCCGTHSGGCR